MGSAAEGEEVELASEAWVREESQGRQRVGLEGTGELEGRCVVR